MDIIQSFNCIIDKILSMFPFYKNPVIWIRWSLVNKLKGHKLVYDFTD